MYRYDNISSLTLFFFSHFFIIHPSGSQGFVVLQSIFSALPSVLTDNGANGPRRSLRIRSATSRRHLIFLPAEALRPSARPRLHPGSDACRKISRRRRSEAGI